MSRVIALLFLAISWTGVVWGQSSELQALYDQFNQLAESEKYAEAIPVVQKMLELEEIEYGPESSGYAWSLGLLAILYENVGDFAKAEQFYKRSLEIYAKALDPEHPDVAIALKNLALLLVSHYYRYEEAEPLYLRALAIEEKALGLEHPEVATTLSNLAELYGRQGRHYDDIGPLRERARKIRYKADFPQIAPLRHEADAFWRYGDDSQSSYTRNVELYEKIEIKTVQITGTATGINFPGLTSTE